MMSILLPFSQGFRSVEVCLRSNDEDWIKEKSKEPKVILKEHYIGAEDNDLDKTISTLLREKGLTVSVREAVQGVCLEQG